MSRTQGFAFAALALAVQVACQSKAAPEIVFGSDRDGGTYRLFRIPAAGGSPRPLQIDLPGEHRDPRVSPDGRRLVFTCIDGGRSQLVVKPWRTAGAARPIPGSVADDQPDWAPDGRRLVFRSRRDGDSGLYVSRADGSGVVRLSPQGAYDRWPRWSPDGRTIVFSSVVRGSVELWRMDPDGSNRTRLTKAAALDARPSWSPDGRSLVFHASSSDSAKHDVILTVAADGSGRRILHGGRSLREEHVDRNTANWAPSYSPDGRTILFVSTRSGNAELYCMDADGGNVRRLTTSPAQDDMPCWVPGVR